eukprot:symbB.v1.2.029405.t1/scaffold3212.1/size61073/3
MARRNSTAATFAMAPGFDEGKWREFRPSSSWVFGSWEALETLLIPSVSICVIAQILEQKLWPFNVKA